MQYKEERSPIVQMLKNAINTHTSEIDNQPKPAIKKTTQQYQPLQATDTGTTKKVTFI
jgi:hypothetical protein